MRSDDIQKTIDAINLEILDLDTDIVDKELEQLRTRLSQLNSKRQNMMTLRAEKFVTLRRTEREKEAALKIEEIEAESKARQTDTQALIDAADERTRDAAWRARAMPHQIDGAHRVVAAQGRMLIADTMGTGKTLQSLIACDMLGAKKVLVVCPGEVMLGFQQECNKWSPERAALTIGKLDNVQWSFMMNLLKMRDEFFCIINFEAWRSRTKSVINDLKGLGFDTVIIDEAHVIKEVNSLSFEGVHAIVNSQNTCPLCKREGNPRLLGTDMECDKHGFITLARAQSVDNVLCMTGTPILNRPDEMYPLLNLLHPSLFDSKWAFNNSFCEKDEDGKWGFAIGGEQRLVKIIQGFYMRRTMKDAGVVLPKQDFVVHRIEVDTDKYANQAELLEMLYEDSAIEISENTSATIAYMIAKIARIRQAACWPGGITLKVEKFDDDGNHVLDEKGEKVYDLIPIADKYRVSQKIDRAVELVRELNEAGHRVVVFSQFSTALDEMQKRLGARAICFTGATKPADKFAVKMNFNRETEDSKKPKWDTVLANFKVGGVGVTFTAATAMIILDEEWNDGKNEQAYGRINRIGQTEETQVHILRLVHEWEGSRDETDKDIALDQWMADLVAMKKRIVQGFSEEMDLAATLRKKFGA